ncbi:hypothetical protein BSKO_01191 [Bryopsis sp. KO-2023]|nr:hypothetical protein BSKO_01191 [Bryopsis sp. KO-2023]
MFTKPSTILATVPDTSRDIGGDEAVSESVTKEVFTSYVCRSRAQRGLPHPGDIAEASSLGAISLPDKEYPLWDSLPEEVVTQGKLSQLQLEGVFYACAKHLEWLPNGERAGFFIGDGAGVGKGRQISGIVLDNYARGRRKHVWFSTSTDLSIDATRDLRDLGSHLNVINGCKELDKEQRAFGLAKDFQEGVLFLTYSTLISSTQKRSRLDQIVDWVGGEEFDGCLIFDECHKAKNFSCGNVEKSTKVSLYVIDIQKKLPKARVVYCSATGVSDVGNMAYMSRMGLWNEGTAFADFKAFFDSMKTKGVSLLEMLAMEMKAEGKYVARGLAFSQAEFVEVQCNLTPDQVRIYDSGVGYWHTLRAKLTKALDLTLTESREIWKHFWGSQQQFFKLLCVSMKVPHIVEEVKQALENGNAVVVGFQSTGEAAVDVLGVQPGEECGFLSTTRIMLKRFLELHFPVRMDTKKPGAKPGEFVHESREVPECIQMREALLNTVDRLDLPSNFLDELVDKLGGVKCVAEMTGRRGRIVREGRRKIFRLRAKPDSSEMDSLNVRERNAFMKGEKLVALISDAASTGISLHASRTCKNQKRRVHITIELPWSADKAIQQLGRSHRSNQVSAPLYKLVSTNVGGERRFVAAVARRLQSLGALTRGDRRAASGIDLSESNFDSPFGRKSLRRIYDSIVQESSSLPNGVDLGNILKGAQDLDWKGVFDKNAKEPHRIELLHRRLMGCVDMMGVGSAGQMYHNDNIAEQKVPGGASSSIKDVGDVRRFLNRLLGLPISTQTILFNYFAGSLEAEITMAKAEGRYSEGVSDLPGRKITKASPPRAFWVDPRSGLACIQNEVTIDRGLAFEDGVRILELERSHDDDSGFRSSRHPIMGMILYMLAIQKPGHKNTFRVFRPNTGESYFDMQRDDLERKYMKVSMADAKDHWDEVYEKSLTTCMHGMQCPQGQDCQAGKRVTNVTILSGSVVRIWGCLEKVLTSHEGSLMRSDRQMRVVRVGLEDESHLVGIRFPKHLLGDVKVTLETTQAEQTWSSEAASKRTVASSGENLGFRKLEEVAPVNQKSFKKAYQAPRTVLDYFGMQNSRKVAGQSAAGKRKAGDEGTGGHAGKRQARESMSFGEENRRVGGNGRLDTESLDVLVSMGFDRKRSEKALMLSNGDIERAADSMLS